MATKLSDEMKIGKFTLQYSTSYVLTIYAPDSSDLEIFANDFKKDVW